MYKQQCFFGHAVVEHEKRPIGRPPKLVVVLRGTPPPPPVTREISVTTRTVSAAAHAALKAEFEHFRSLVTLSIAGGGGGDGTQESGGTQDCDSTQLSDGTLERDTVRRGIKRICHETAVEYGKHGGAALLTGSDETSRGW